MILFVKCIWVCCIWIVYLFDAVRSILNKVNDDSKDSIYKSTNIFIIKLN